MNNFFLYMRFGTYMINTLLKKRKIEKIRKIKGDQEAEKLVNKCVYDWAKYLIDNVGIDINVKGLENLPKGNCLYVANHQSLFDIPVLLVAIGKPMGFIAKKEMENLAIISSWMKAIHCVFMDRANVREAIKAINQGIKNLNDGYSMVIFPEGTRSKGPKVGEFKKGSMKLATKSKVPVVPITIDGTYKVREGNEKNKIKPAKVNIIINKPIYMDELTKEQQGSLAQDIREIIKSQIEQ